MKFACHKCGQHLDADDEMGGTETACPTCSAPIKVPTAHPTANASEYKGSKTCAKCNDPVHVLAHVCPCCGDRGTLVANISQDELTDILNKQAAARTLVDQSMAFMQQGQFDAAENVLRGAQGINPYNACAFGNMGGVYFLRGRFAEAIPWLEKALALDPTLEGIPEHLATARERTGHTKGAVCACETVGAMPPVDPLQQQTVIQPSRQSDDTPLVKQIKRTTSHLLSIGKAGEFTIADIPDYEPEYLADLESHIDWGSTPPPDPADRARILRATASEELLKTLVNRNLSRKLGDSGLYAVFSLEPEARQPPWVASLQDESEAKRVTRLVQELKDRNWRVRLQAAEKLGMMGQNAAVAVPALIQSVKEDKTIAGNSAAKALGQIGAAAAAAVSSLLERWNRDQQTEWECKQAADAILGSPAKKECREVAQQKGSGVTRQEEPGQKVPCSKCGRLLPETVARRQGSLCASCTRSSSPSWWRRVFLGRGTDGLSSGPQHDVLHTMKGEELKANLRDALTNAWPTSCTRPVEALDGKLQSIVGWNPTRLRMVSADGFVCLLGGCRPEPDVKTFNDYDESIIDLIIAALTQGKQIALAPAHPQGFVVIVGHNFFR